jgi:anti-sigma factor RsiW
MNGDEFLKATMEAADKGEIPLRVSNKMLWALAVDAKKERKWLRNRISRNELRAAGIGGAAGLIAAIAALIAAL